MSYLSTNNFNCDMKYSRETINSATAAAVLNTKTADYKRKLEKEFNQKQVGEEPESKQHRV